MDSYHGADPFTGVNSSVEEDGRLGTLSSTSPNVDTGQGTPLNGGSRSDNLRLTSEAGLKVAQELDMVGIWMVSREP